MKIFHQKTPIGAFRPALWILLVVLCNIGFRLIYIDYGSYFLDESANLWYYQQGMDAVIQRSLNDANPPVYGTLIHYWILLFGVSEVSTRTFSVIAIAICGALLFEFSRRKFNLKTALLISVLFLFSDYLFHYSHAARPYCLMCLEATLSYFLLYKFLELKSWKLLLAIFLTNTLMLYTHPTTVFNLMAQGIFVLVYSMKDKFLFIKIAFVHVISVLLYFIWYSISPAFDRPAKTWLGLPDLLKTEYIINRLLNGFWPLSIMIIALTLLILFFRRQSIVPQNRIWLIALLSCWIFIPPILNAVFSHVTEVSIYTPQYMINILPGFYLLLGILIFSTGQILKLPVILIALPVSLVMLFSLNYETTFDENWRATANFVKSEQDDSTVVFLSPQFQHRSLTYYYQRSFYENYDSTFYLMNKSDVFFENSTPIESLLGDSSYNKMLFVIVSETPELNNNLIKATNHADVTDLKKLNDIYIYRIGPF